MNVEGASHVECHGAAREEENPCAPAASAGSNSRRQERTMDEGCWMGWGGADRDMDRWFSELRQLGLCARQALAQHEMGLE